MKGEPKLHTAHGFVMNAKLTPPKSLRLFLFLIFSAEIFRIGVELPQDLIYRPGFLS